MPIRKIAFIVFISLALAGCGSKEVQTGPEKEPINSFSVTPGIYPVKITSSGFSPAEISFEPGTQVIWTNEDSVPHSIISDDLTELKSPELNTGEKFELVVSQKGTYSYRCGLHPETKGKLIVK